MFLRAWIGVPLSHSPCRTRDQLIEVMEHPSVGNKLPILDLEAFRVSDLTQPDRGSFTVTERYSTEILLACFGMRWL